MAFLLPALHSCVFSLVLQQKVDMQCLPPQLCADRWVSLQWHSSPVASLRLCGPVPDSTTTSAVLLV